MNTGAVDVEAAAVLSAARRFRREANTAETGVLQMAIEWAKLHQVDSLDDAATWPGGHGQDTGIPIAGEGCPLVSEFAVAELATALGLSAGSGRNLIAQALELAYRLPKLWARVQAGTVGAVAGPKGRRGNPQRLPVGGGRGLGRCPGRAVRPQDRGRPDPAAGGDRDHPAHAAPLPPSAASGLPSSGTSPSTTTRSPSPAPAGSTASSTSPTPWTSKTPSPPAPPSSPRWATPTPSMSAAPLRSD